MRTESQRRYEEILDALLNVQKEVFSEFEIPKGYMREKKLGESEYGRLLKSVIETKKNPR